MQIEELELKLLSYLSQPRQSMRLLIVEWLAILLHHRLLIAVKQLNSQGNGTKSRDPSHYLFMFHKIY